MTSSTIDHVQSGVQMISERKQLDTDRPLSRERDVKAKQKSSNHKAKVSSQSMIITKDTQLELVTKVTQLEWITKVTQLEQDWGEK